MEGIVEVQGPPRYIEHEVEVPITTKKQVQIPVDVHTEEIVEQIDEREINILRDKLS